MIIKTQQKDLINALILTSGFAKNNSQLPILNNVFIKIDKKVMEIQATDLIAATKVRIGVIGEDSLEFLIQANNLLEYLQALNSGEVTMDIAEDKLTVSQIGSKAKFPLIKAGDFPQIKLNQKLVGIKVIGEEFLNAIRWASIAVSIEDNRPALTGLLFQKKDNGNGLMIVGSDGYRLSVADIRFKGDFDGSVLIPCKSLLSIAKEIGNTEVEIFIDRKTNQAYFSASNILVAIRLISEEFPNFKKILPETFQTSVEVEYGDLSSVIKQVSIFARQNANIIKLEIAEKIKISSQEGYAGSGYGELDCKFEGEKLGLGFNFRYLQDYLRSINDGLIKIGFNGQLAPVKLTSEQKPSYIHVIMPVKL